MDNNTKELAVISNTGTPLPHISIKNKNNMMIMNCKVLFVPTIVQAIFMLHQRNE